MSRNINTPTERKQSGDEVTVNIDTRYKTEVRPLSAEGESSRRGAIVFGGPWRTPSGRGGGIQPGGGGKKSR